MRSNWWAEALGALLVGLTEGAWITVVYGLVETVGLDPAPIGLGLFALVAFGGALVGPSLERLGEARWRIMIGATVLAGLAGTALGPGVLAELARGDPGAAFGAHPGGWLLGLAGFRGMLGGGSLDDPDRATRPLLRGVIVVSLAWLYAGLLPDSGQAAFRSGAFGPTLIFVATGIAGAGLRRVAAIALTSGIRWWQNRAWLAILAGFLVGLTILALAVARGLTVLEPSTLALPGFGEVVILGAIVGLLVVAGGGPRRPPVSARSALILGLLFLAIASLYSVLHSQDRSGPAPSPPAGLTGASEGNGMIGWLIVGVVVVVFAVVTIVLARNWRRATTPIPAGRFIEEADYELAAPGSGWLGRIRDRLGGLGQARRPASAEAAYLATLAELEPLRAQRRQPIETPAGHARRLHREGFGSLELDLLAANYELSRWGGRRLPERETRRAIGRWERSRVRIAHWIEAERAAQVHDGQGPVGQAERADRS